MIALLIYCELNPLMAKARLIRKNIDLKLTRSICATAASMPGIVSITTVTLVVRKRVLELRHAMVRRKRKE